MSERVIRDNQTEEGTLHLKTFVQWLQLVLISVGLGSISALPLRAQLIIKLSPETLQDFQRYADTIEASLNERWQGKKNFLSVEDDKAAEDLLLQGEPLVRPAGNNGPVEIRDGLVHDWVGAIYMPNVRIERVLKVLQDFDNHKNIYPSVADSRLIERNGNEVTGYWRLEEKGIIPVTLNVEQQAHYQQLSPGKWKCQAYARKIIEINTGLFGTGRPFPADEGHGYLWRLYSYWSLEEYRGGVLAECRTLSLSRNIPSGLAWAVGPYMQKMPQNSLTSTLTRTRDAATE